jgi:ABC-type multidrug transport system ATPase subunit
MGGSGKTTLTKAILHRVHQGFEATSFVANMKDSKIVLDIQRQLLKDLKYVSSISTIDEGLKCLQNVFQKKKGLCCF